MIEKSYIFFILIFIFSLLLYFTNKKEFYKDYYIYANKLNAADTVSLDFNQIDIDTGKEKDTLNEKRLISLNDFLNFNYIKTETETPKPTFYTLPTSIPTTQTEKSLAHKRFIYCIKEKGIPNLNQGGVDYYDSEVLDDTFHFDWEYRPLHNFNAHKRPFRPLMNDHGSDDHLPGNYLGDSGANLQGSIKPLSGKNTKEYDLPTYVRNTVNNKEFISDVSPKSLESIAKDVGQNYNNIYHYLTETDIELVCQGSFGTKIRLSDHFFKKITDDYSNFFFTSLLKGHYKYKDINSNYFKAHVFHPRIASILMTHKKNELKRVNTDYLNAGAGGSDGYTWDWEYKLEIYEVSDKISDYSMSNFFEKNIRMYDQNAAKWGTNKVMINFNKLQGVPINNLIESGIVLKVFESSQQDFRENRTLFFGEQKYTEESLKHDDGPIIYKYILECNSTIEIKDTLVIKDPGSLEKVIKPGIPDDDGKINDTDKIKPEYKKIYPLIDNIKRIKNLPIMFKEKICLQNKNGAVACLSPENIDVVNGIRPIKINTFPKNPVFDIPMKYEDNVKMCLEASKISTLNKAQHVFKGAPCNNSKEQDFFLKFYDKNNNVITDFHPDTNIIPKQPHLHFHKHIDEHENESKRDVVRTDVEDDVQQDYINT